MADAYFFVDPVNGNDATGDGTLAAPVMTPTRAAGASGIFTLSTTGTNYLVLIPSGIFRGTLALGLTPTLSGPLVIAGDHDGAIQKAQGATTPIVADEPWVDWRGWTNDTTPLTTELISASGKSYVTIQGVKMLGGQPSNPSCLNLAGTWSDWTIQDCCFVAMPAKPIIAWITGAAGAALNLTVRRCEFHSIPTGGFGVDVRMPLHTSEYDINVLVQNCKFFGCSVGARLAQVGGSGTFYATGLKVQNCSFFYCGTCVNVGYGAGVALTTPSTVKNCWMTLCTTGVSAGQATQLAETANAICTATPRTSVSAGTDSVTVAAPAFDVGSGRSDAPGRAFGTPSLQNGISAIPEAGTPPTVDATNLPRPAGLGVAHATVGALERHRTARKETTTVDAGGVGWRIDGPGDDCLVVAVNGGEPTTIVVKGRYDSTHGSTNKPYAVLRANAECGVATQTVTMTAAVNTWESIAFSSFTPAADGFVIVDLFSRAAGGAGKAFFDTAGVS